MKTKPPSIDINIPPWLFARTRRCLDQTALIVIRSVACEETYSKYREVLDFIEQYKFQLAWEGSIFGGVLMFQEGRISCFFTEPAGEKGLDEGLIEDLKAEGEEIVGANA